MEYTKHKNKHGILFFIAFEKAFDSLEWDFLNKCLELFNFGPDGSISSTKIFKAVS